MTRLTKAQRKHYAAASTPLLESTLRNLENAPTSRVKTGRAKGQLKMRVIRELDTLQEEIRTRRHEAAAPFIGELCREGVTVFYVNTPAGPEEFAERIDAVYYVLDRGLLTSTP